MTVDIMADLVGDFVFFVFVTWGLLTYAGRFIKKEEANEKNTRAEM